MADESHVNFVVIEFGDDPQVVTALMGVEPSDSWVVGDPFPNHPTALRRGSRWVLKSGLDLGVHVDEQLVALLAVLRQRTERVLATANRFPSYIQCAIYYKDSTPGINLSEEVVRDIAELGLSIDFDLYFLGEE